MDGDTPLHEAARHGAPPKLVRALILAGASLDSTNDSGCTALEFGWNNAGLQAAVMAAVKERGEQLDSHCYFGRRVGRLSDLPTPLHRAAVCNQPGVLRALLSQGHSPDVAAKTSHATPLILAAELGHEACVRELLAAAANPDAADSLGNTATYYAAACGHWHCLRSLLIVGASCDKPCKDGETALQAAAKEGEEPLCADAPAAACSLCR